MIIQRRGLWKKVAQADLDTQLSTIATKVQTYQKLLGIPQTDVDRIVAADAMNKYINTARSLCEAFVKSLTKYDDELRDGNVLQQMNDFPPMPVLDVAPPATFAGVWHFIENRRTMWTANDNCSPAVGEDMTILGPMQNFDTDTYKPKLTEKTGAGVIHVHTDSTDIDTHNLYAAISGKPLVLITSFKGAKYDYHRVLAVTGQAESVDLQVQGLYKNELIGKMSDVVTLAYNG